MSTTLLFHAILGLAALAVLGASGGSADDEATLKRELQALSERRVFFGHQSVGFNILDGLRDLSARSGVPVRIADAVPGGVPPATFGHAPVAANGDPLRKLRSFEQAFASGAARGADIALVKFCYVDFTDKTDVAALFAEYQATLGRLKAANPGTTFVHVTAPLTTVQKGPKALLKRIAGRSPWGAVENQRRAEWNDLVRKTFAAEPVFDLARAEATRPDGTEERTDWQGRSSPALVADYTDDGGHLNAEGRMRAARELVSSLARVQPRPAAGANQVGR